MRGGDMRTAARASGRQAARIQAHTLAAAVRRRTRAEFAGGRMAPAAGANMWKIR